MFSSYTSRVAHAPSSVSATLQPACVDRRRGCGRCLPSTLLSLPFTHNAQRMTGGARSDGFIAPIAACFSITKTYPRRSRDAQQPPPQKQHTKPPCMQAGCGRSLRSTAGVRLRQLVLFLCVTTAAVTTTIAAASTPSRPWLLLRCRPLRLLTFQCGSISSGSSSMGRSKTTAGNGGRGKAAAAATATAAVKVEGGWIDLRVPPHELRPEFSLTMGQCFNWKRRVAPSSAGEAGGLQVSVHALPWACPAVFGLVWLTMHTTHMTAGGSSGRGAGGRGGGGGGVGRCVG